MAQKAAKQQASRNSAVLRRLHLSSLGVNVLFIVLRFAVFRSTATTATIVLYAMFSAPALMIELWFERSGRPTLTPYGDLTRAGDDLDAKGLTEYMFDVLYWTWGTIAVAAVFGDRAWWLWMAVPAYSAYLAVTTFGSVRKGMAGLAGVGAPGGAEESTSNRQKKMEKRGGQRIQHR